MEEVAIGVCPPDEVPHALEVLYGGLPADERRVMVATMGEWLAGETAAREGLFVARDRRGICGAVLVQEQPGRTAILWPPDSSPRDPSVDLCLAQAADRHLVDRQPALAQALLPDPADPVVEAIKAVGFVRLAELEYLIASARPAAAERGGPQIRLEAYHEAQRPRLRAVVEATYRDSLDCPQLDGTRHMDDVLAGYQATGQFDPGKWFFVLQHGRDVGVLLLTEHAGTRQWELVYMGLVPEVRGRGIGRAVVDFALQRAHEAGAESILMAVDTANLRAVNLYRDCGFRGWNRRVVYWKKYGCC